MPTVAKDVRMRPHKRSLENHFRKLKASACQLKFREIGTSLTKQSKGLLMIFWDKMQTHSSVITFQLTSSNSSNVRQAITMACFSTPKAKSLHSVKASKDNLEIINRKCIRVIPLSLSFQSCINKLRRDWIKWNLRSQGSKVELMIVQLLTIHDSECIPGASSETWEWTEEAWVWNGHSFLQSKLTCRSCRMNLCIIMQCARMRQTSFQCRASRNWLHSII